MFKINNKVWDVQLVSPTDEKLFRSDGSLSIGTCDNNDKTIYLNKNLNDFMLNKVLCHEITHAAMFSYNVNITIEQEELLADLLATYGEEIIAITNKVFKKLRDRL